MRNAPRGATALAGARMPQAVLRATKATPKATPMTAVTRMSRVRQRVSVAPATLSALRRSPEAIFSCEPILHRRRRGRQRRYLVVDPGDDVGQDLRSLGLVVELMADPGVGPAGDAGGIGQQLRRARRHDRVVEAMAGARGDRQAGGTLSCNGPG